MALSLEKQQVVWPTARWIPFYKSKSWPKYQMLRNEAVENVKLQSQRYESAIAFCRRAAPLVVSMGANWTPTLGMVVGLVLPHTAFDFHRRRPLLCYCTFLRAKRWNAASKIRPWRQLIQPKKFKYICKEKKDTSVYIYGGGDHAIARSRTSFSEGFVSARRKACGDLREEQEHGSLFF